MTTASKPGYSPAPGMRRAYWAVGIVGAVLIVAGVTLGGVGLHDVLTNPLCVQVASRPSGSTYSCPPSVGAPWLAIGVVGFFTGVHVDHPAQDDLEVTNQRMAAEVARLTVRVDPDLYWPWRVDEEGHPARIRTSVRIDAACRARMPVAASAAGAEDYRWQRN